MVCLRVCNSGTGDRVGKRFGQVVQAHQGEQIMYSKHFINRDMYCVHCRSVSVMSSAMHGVREQAVAKSS